MALFELGEDKAALADVEGVISSVPDPKASRDAVELKAKIEARMKKGSSAEVAPAKKPPTPTSATSPTSTKTGASSGEGWKRMQIVEASDSSEEEEETAVPQKKQAAATPEEHPDIVIERTKPGIEKAKEKANSLFS